MSKIISQLFIAIILLAIIPVVSADNCVCTGDPIEPNYGTATVDGNNDEWSEADYFGTMYNTGIYGNPPLSDAYVKYDCEYQILYVLVLLRDNYIIENNVDKPEENHFVRLGCGGSLVVVDANDLNSGTQPNFMYIEDQSGNKIGWEASAYVSPITSDLSIHTQVYEDQTSALNNRCVKLDICCTPIPEFSTIALPIAAILGIMFILQSRKRKED